MVNFAEEAAKYEKEVSNLSYVDSCESNENSLIISINSPEENNPDLISTLVNKGAKIQYVKERNHSLEEVYLHLLNEGGEE